MQVILNVIDHGFNIAEAIEAGRIHHQWLPTSLVLNPMRSLPTPLIVTEIVVTRPESGIHRGRYGGLRSDQDLFLGAADSRRGDGGAVGY